MKNLKYFVFIFQMSDAWSLSILRLLARVNSFNQPGSSKSICKSFLCNAQHIGWIREDAAQQLRRYPDVFIENSDQYVKNWDIYS